MKKVIVSIALISSVLFSCKKKEDINCKKSVFKSSDKEVEFVSSYDDGGQTMLVNGVFTSFQYVDSLDIYKSSIWDVKVLDKSNLILSNKSDSFKLNVVYVPCNREYNK